MMMKVGSDMDRDPHANVTDMSRMMMSGNVSAMADSVPSKEGVCSPQQSGNKNNSGWNTIELTAGTATNISPGN